MPQEEQEAQERVKDPRNRHGERLDQVKSQRKVKK